MTSETRQIGMETKRPDAPPPSEYLEAAVGDIERFNELVLDWDLEFRQVDQGAISADLAQRMGTSSNFTRVRLDRAIAQVGGPPPGMRTFGVLQDESPAMEWCGQEVEPSSLLCFHPSAEFQCLSPPGFAVFSLSIREDQLTEVAARLGYPGLFESLDHGTAIDVGGTDGLAELRRLLPRLFVPPNATDVRTAQNEIESLESQITEALVTLVADWRIDPRPVTLSDRAAAARTAVAYILDHSGSALTVSELSEVTGVSWRTLDRAFKERLGTSPKRCINAVRLQALRRALLNAAPDVRVADVANDFGYWHMGDLAMNYRRAFGELPSATLAEQRQPDLG